MPIQTLRNYMASARSSTRTKREKRQVLRRQLGSRFGVEQLEERRLMVADLVNFLTNEHVDLNISNTSGQWQIGPRNSDAVPAIQYGNDDAILYAGSPSVIGRPGGSSFDFIGTGAGQPVYVLPQSQDPEVMYLGFAAYGLDSSLDRYNPSVESKGRASGNARWGKASLVDLRHSNPDGTAGTGQFSVWQSGSFGEAIVSMSSYNDGVSNPNGNGLDTTDGISTDDAIWILSGGHSHYNFGFTQPGRYEVDLRLSAYFGDDGLTTPNAAGFSQSAPITLYFSVMSVGQLQFDASSYSVNEGGGSASINVVRVGGSDGRITVNYATSNGTATSGSDYSARSGTLEFLDGEKIKTITIPITDDSSDEADETVNLTLSNPGPFEVSGPPQPFSIQQYLIDVEGDANGLLGTVTTAVLTIVDNDEPANTPPSISNVEDQVTGEDVATGAIPFIVGDAQTAAGALVVSATSSNTTLVPNANIVLGGSGANRTVTITPASNLFGTSTITLTVTDAGGLTATDTFLLTVNSVNDLPTISDVGNQSTDEDTVTAAIPFTVGDVETSAGVLVVTATSSNTTLVPNANVVLGGSGANRTVTLTPAANQTGTTTITLTVTDEGGLTASDTFTLTVGGVNDAPTISDVGNQSTNEDTATGAIAFTVEDLETAAGSLVVTAISSNTALVPNGNIVFGGSGANRTAVITPALNQFGSTTITLTVTDAGGLSATDSFVLNVESVNDLPTISDIGNQNTPAGPPIGPIGFTIGDVETAESSLTVTAASSNTTLLPLSGIVIAGSGANRTVTLSPAIGQTGTATVTLTVTDAHGGSSSETFDLVVTNNSLPTISDITNRFVVEGSSTGSIAFTVGDNETAAGDLVVTATSSNQSVIPNGNIVLGGSGANRTLTITSVPNQVGPTTITVTVTDAGGLQTSDAFILTVTADSLVPFAVPASFSISKEDGSSSLASADFNGDGKIDVVSVGGFPGSLVLLKGNGDGTFQAGVPVDGGSPYFARTPFAADYDGDGDVDLMTREFDAPPVGIETEGQVAVHLNDGAGNFTRQVIVGGLTLGASAIQVGELNGDGRPDFIRWANSTTLVYHESLPGGGYAPPEVVSSSFTSLNATRFQLEDIDADGDLDILAYDTTPRRLSIFRNDGAGNFGAPQQLTFAASTTVRAVADITGDGRPDILATDTATVYYAQNSDGTFGARTVLPSIGSGVTRMIPTDLNQDGVVDLVIIQSNAPRWAAGRGNGAFGATQLLWASAGVQAVINPDIDGDGDKDIVVGTSTTNTAVTVLENLTGENPMRLIPPAARTYLGGDQINLQVHFGFPITVAGTPRLALQLGANTVYANYVSGSATPTLTFRYTVGATDVDLDGLQLASNTIDLNGGTLTNPEGAPAVLAFPGSLAGVIVNAPGPFVQMVSRLDAATTSAGTVRFSVQFAEDVTGVDVTDFAPRTTEGNLAGAVVQSVTGSGSLYEVTVSTGTGSGTLGLTVLGSASILDLNGDAFSMEYAGGQVYTVRQQPIGTINTYYTDGHADYRPVYSNGDFDHVWHGDPGLLPQNEYSSNELITYLDSTALVTRPAGANFDFLGVNEGGQLYLSNASGSVASVPFMGISGEGLKANVFADYKPSDDSRITSSTLQEYVKVQMVGMRSSSDGDFSLYSTSSGIPTVWMATSDGIVGTDNIWTYPGTHAHYNTAFSKPGKYEIDVVISGYLDLNANNQLDATDVYVESGIKTMVFHVDTLGAVSDSFLVVEGNTLNGNVSLNDDWHASMGAYTASVETAPANGSLMLNANGTFSYAPNPGFAGPDSFVYRVTNERGGFTTATASITVVANRLVPFAMPMYYGSTLSASRSVTGDFNGDGHADKITSSASINTLAYFQGTGTGGFGAERRLNSGLNLFSLGITAVDYDRDNDLDLIAVESSESTFDTFGKGMITLYQNDGAGQFTRVVLKSGLMAGQHVASGDFNGDGRPDLAWSSTSTDPTTFVTTASYDYALQMTGGELGTITTLASNDIFVTLRSEDIDGDGRTDLVAVERTNNPTTTYSLLVRRGNGDGTFSAPLVVTSGSGVTTLRQIVDLNGDGRRDLLVTDTIGDSRLGYYPQQANGSFGSRVSLLQGIGRSLGATSVADINKDGVLDIAAQFLGGAFGSGLVPSIFWVPGIGGGAYGAPIMIAAHNVTVSSVEVLDLDGDAYPDILASGNSSPAVPGAVVAYINKSGENPMVLIPPAPSTRIANDPIDVQVYFGVPITVTGTPRIALNLAGNTVYANYVSGSATPTLRFRYIVSATDVDFDGVQLNSNLIELNGGTLTDPIGGAGRLDFPNVIFNGVFVNARGPLVQMITRLDENPTSAATARFAVQFNEAVNNVDLADFSVRSKEGNLTGASVLSVTGSGSQYQVTVSTGNGTGALGLSINDSATIFDGLGRSLAKGYVGGQVYTVRQQPIVDVDHYYTDGHADYRPLYNNGEFSFELHGSEELPSDEVITYLDNTAIVSRPADASYDFIGVIANQPIYLANASGTVVTVPFIGWSGESVPVNIFAEYLPSDPRITSAIPREFLKVQLVAMRSSSSGHFSMYQTDIGNPPKVWMATSNGIASDDNFWLNPGQHIHLNTTFSKSGVYEVDVAISGFLDSNANNAYDPLVDTYVESGIKTMVFHVDTLGARNDAFEVSGKDMLRGSVTLNDEWNDGLGAYTASIQTTTTKGTLSLQPNGSFTYQPSASFDGSDSFTYRLTNERGGFTTATVTFTGSVRPDFDAVLKTGHADIGVNFADDAWDLHIHRHEPDTEYEPNAAKFYVGRDAMLTRSGDSANAAYDFLGASVGSTLFVLPEIENTNLLFLGIGGEELADGLLQGDVAKLRLASVSGPGHFSMWQAGLTPTTPKLLMATADGIDASDAFDVAAGSHAHANFAFTKQGFYEVTFVASGIDADGNATDSGQVTYYFLVTDGLVPFSMPSFLDTGLGVAGFQSQIADFNGDGKLDLIVAGSGVDALGYRQGVGDGSFLLEQRVNAGVGLSAQGIVAVDYDLDGDMDFVTLEYVQSVDDTGSVTLFRNNGSASFTRVVLKSGLPTGYQVVAGDLNQDGRPDLVYNKGATSVAYALQLPNGELGAESVLPATLSSLSGLLIGDMDNDNDLDIVVGNRANSPNAYFSVLLNDGNAVFGAPQNKTTGIFPDVHALADLNGDGRLDVITGESVAGSRAGYYPQLTDGTFGSRVIVLPTNTQLNSIEIGDINGDGVPDIVAGAIVGNRFSAVWSPGNGDGTFGATILINPNEGNAWSINLADLDGDHHLDILTTGGAPSATAPSAVRVYINKTGENPMVLTPPAARTRVVNDSIELSVYFGFPITVTGTPRIALDLGGNTVYANYVSGSGTPTLTFRYLVTATDLDLDGVQLASNLIDLNGGTLTDPLGGQGVLGFPNQTFTGVVVNGRGPLVQSITRLDSQLTDAGSVRFNVQFAEPVTNVGIADFSVRMIEGNLAGAAITGVTGSGSVYEVTVSTGTGSGTLGLSVNDGASINDLSGDVLATGYAGGQVYTVRLQPVGPIDNYYVDGHADYRPVYNNGEFSYVWHGDAGVLPQEEYSSDEVITYIDSQAIVNRPTTSNYNFLGVGPGQPLYVNPSTQVVGTPFLGWSGDSLVANVFADYRPTEDPRITSATLREYVKVQMVGFRSDSGGDFSLYSGSAPTVWMATSDGIGSTDSFWLYRTHFHRNTAFSKPGRYEIDVIVSGYLDGNANNALDASDVYVESGIKTMVFHVDTLGARNDAFEIAGKDMLRGSVTLNDEWNDGLGAYTASVQTTTLKGTLSLQPNGSFTYQPSATFDGSDSFTYQLTNPRGGFTTATVMITGSVRPEFEAVLRSGHADIGVNFADDAWDLHVHQHEPDTEYEPDAARFYVGRDAMVTRTGDAANAAYDFLGAPVGSTLFVLPEVENPNLLFLGIGGEELADGLLQGDVAKLRLASVSGPGHFSMWQAGLAPTTPKLLMATADGIDASDAFDVAAGSHAHANFAFTKIGFYEVTFVASGVDADGNATDSGQVTYYFQVGNTVDALDVQNGQVQRSFVRNVDLVFGEEDNMADLLATGRISVTKFDLNGENGVPMVASAWSTSTVGNRLRMDFGVQGIGGNRNDTTADGYYRIGIDIDGDGTADAFKHFYRLLGDVNGDRQVNALDRLLVMRGNVPGSPSVDVNGDGVVNAVDLTLVTRGQGKKLKNGLWIDD